MRERLHSSSSPVWGTSTPNQEPPLRLPSSHPSCQGNAYLWDGRAGKWARKVPIQRVLAKPPVKRQRCNIPPGSGKASVPWSKETKRLVPVQGSCLWKPWGGTDIDNGALGQKDSFGMVWPLGIPDPPGWLHGLKQAQGWAQGGQGREWRGICYKSPLACWPCLGFPGAAHWTPVRFCNPPPPLHDHPEHSLLRKF